MKNETDQNNWQILYGGKDIEVTVLSPDSTPKRQSVKVRKLGLKDLPKIAGAMQETETEAALYIGESSDFVSTLLPEDALRIVEEGRELNAKSFAVWVKQRKAQAELMGLDLEKAMQKAATEAAKEEMAKENARASGS